MKKELITRLKLNWLILTAVQPDVKDVKRKTMNSARSKVKVLNIKVSIELQKYGDYKIRACGEKSVLLI